MKVFLLTILTSFLISCGSGGTPTPTTNNDFEGGHGPIVGGDESQRAIKQPALIVKVTFIKDGVLGDFILQGNNSQEIMTQFEQELNTRQLDVNNNKVTVGVSENV